ncbi:MAG: hypothetical protein ACUVT3_02955, partial [Ignavibacterium sp.]
LIYNIDYDLQFGEKYGYHSVPVVHNGFLFQRGAFWKFNTTVTGYFTFPILYQNDYTTGIINLELVPTKVDTSKGSHYVTYSPFEYWLPNVSGTLLQGIKSTKIYEVDFTNYLITSKTGNDERVFDVLDDFVYTSGSLEDNRMIGIPENNNLFVRDIEFSEDFALMKTTNNTIYHIEASNLPSIPFIFLSDSGSFYEFNKTSWTTYGLPPAKILEIRVDDLL